MRRLLLRQRAFISDGHGPMQLVAGESVRLAPDAMDVER
jgi:hypothetical protein